MLNLNILDVVIKDRKRKLFGKLEELSESIKEYGLISPICVEKIEDKYHLIAGERRIRASLIAGLTHIDAVERRDLTAIARKEIELHENFHRKGMDWTEETALVADIHHLKQEELGVGVGGSKTGKKIGWSMADTAVKLETTKSAVSRDIELDTYLKENPELKAAFAIVPKTVAIRKMQQLKESAKLEVSLEAGDLEITGDLILGNYIDEMSKLEDNSVDMILTDPPYGTEAVEEGKSKQILMESKDNLDAMQVKNLLLKLLQLSYMKLKPGRHMYLFFSLEYYNIITDYADRIGFKYNRFPIIWDKDQAMTAGTGLNYTRSWEPVLFLYKPAPNPHDTRSLFTHQKDIIRFKIQSNKDKIHAFQKPIELLQFLIKQSSLEGETILDPFGGSGSTIVAARAINRSAVAIEINEDHYNRSQLLLSQHA